MSNRDYFEKLRKTETYRESLVTQPTPWWFRPFSSPKPSQEQHILAIKMRDSKPSVYAKLTDDSPGLSFGERITNNLGYISVEMGQKTLKVPPISYDFEDVHKHQVKVTIILEYQVVEAKILIQDNRDAIKELKQLVNNTVQSYLSNIGSGSVGLAFLEESIKAHLQQTICNTEQELGIEVKQISVEITLSQGQEQHKEKQDRIKNVAGLLKAIKVSGVPLKTIIENLDARLMLHFYNLSWEDAMSRLQDRLSEIIEGKDYEKKIKLLKDIGTDEMYIEKARMNIANTVNASLSTAPGTYDISAFVSQIQSLPPSYSSLPKTVGDDQISQDTSDSDGKKEPATIADAKASDTIELKRQFGTYQKTWGEILVANELLETIRISDMSLKTIIENLDIRLLLNFYYLSWDEAMDELQIRLNDIIEGKDYEKKIKLLQDIGTDEMYIDKVRMNIADIVNTSLSTAETYNISTFVSQIQPLPQPQDSQPEIVSNE